MATIVLKLGGAVCLEPATVAAVADEIKALQAAGHAVVLVHGGGPQLDKALADLGETVQKIDGLRVTSKPAAKIVLKVMDAIGKDLAWLLNEAGVKANHLPAVAEGFQATPKKSDKGDLGRVGTVSRFTAGSRITGAREVAVVTPVGFDAQGPLNINADEGAAFVATALRVKWLVLATDVAAVRGAEGEALSKLTPRSARKLILENTASGGMIPKLTAAVAALSGGVTRVIITKIQPGLLQDAVLRGKIQGTLIENDLAVA
ncbi:MAG: acetylglutamate kinase [Candidatus Thermoplasmatota archaeon]|jgi:acetylglutamate kinase